MTTSPNAKKEIHELQGWLKFDGYRKTRRMVKRRLKAAHQEYRQATQDPSISGRAERMRKAATNRDAISVLLDITESYHLLRKAERLSLELPKEKTDWWYSSGSIPEATDISTDVLTKKGQSRVSKLIREEHRKTLEWWARILTPILALIVSALGLLVALASLRQKITR
jgi:lipopolysaccharide export LptBFGC system permease protein LptF